MKWPSPTGSVLTRLRETSRGAALLALLAMAIQIVSAFGHVHLADLSPSFKQASYAKAAPAHARSAVAAADDAASLPSGGDGDALCAICLVGHLVASGAFAGPPVLVLPVAYLLLGPPQPVASVHRIDVAASFWSRGPPRS